MINFGVEIQTAILVFLYAQFIMIAKYWFQKELLKIKDAELLDERVYPKSIEYISEWIRFCTYYSWVFLFSVVFCFVRLHEMIQGLMLTHVLVNMFVRLSNMNKLSLYKMQAKIFFIVETVFLLTTIFIIYETIISGK